MTYVKLGKAPLAGQAPRAIAHQGCMKLLHSGLKRQAASPIIGSHFFNLIADKIMDIAGKVFMVTGGASGLGEGTARMLSAAGGKVLVLDMQVDKGQAVADSIGGAFMRCDVSSETDAQAAIAHACAMGTLRGLVNCAGVATAEKTIGKQGAHTLSTFKIGRAHV